MEEPRGFAHLRPSPPSVYAQGEGTEEGCSGYTEDQPSKSLRNSQKEELFNHYFSHHCDEMPLLPETTCGRWGLLGLLISELVHFDGRHVSRSIHL